ncbi:hypothetical protein BKA57DRAFT_280505 [Linnemannia elongata]|nr:hypothetical protein BKA57DRAFT_280505 [Linnemannia elongata]
MTPFFPSSTLRQPFFTFVIVDPTILIPSLVLSLLFSSLSFPLSPSTSTSLSPLLPIELSFILCLPFNLAI